jgi:hypothetical protein
LGINMHATIRRYESVDQSRTDELIQKVNTGLVPLLSKMPGFAGYRFIAHGQGVMTSIGLFETEAQADESSRVAADWVAEEKLSEIVPKPPQVTTGRVVAQADRELASV